MAKTTILIVDDTEATRNVLRDIVQEILREGVEISTASSLEQGMGFAERVQKGNIVLDAAFIDIELGKDPVTHEVHEFGFPLMEALRDLCLVFPMSSAMGIPEYQEKCRELGMEVMITKPFDLQEIEELFLLP